MFRLTSPKLLELFHTRTITQLWTSAVKWHFNVNYRRPYLVVTLAEASLLSRSAAPVYGTYISMVWHHEATAKSTTQDGGMAETYLWAETSVNAFV